MDDFLPATVYAYSTWPKGTPNYWALPAMGDALGWVYRKDWFENARDPGRVQGEDRPRPRPAEDLDRAEGSRRVLPGPRDRRQEGLRRRDLHRARLGRHHHGRHRGALRLRLQVRERRPATTTWKAWSTRADAVAALEVYKELYKCCTPPGYSDAYMQEGLDAFKSGQVAMMMNWFAFWPGMYKDENVGGDKIGFFVNPGEKAAASTLGGQGISVVSYSDNQDGALAVHQVVRPARGAEEVVVARRLSPPKAVLLDPGFADIAALRGRLPRRHGPGPGLLAGAGLRRADAGDAEARA